MRFMSWPACAKQSLRYFINCIANSYCRYTVTTQKFTYFVIENLSKCTRAYTQSWESYFIKVIYYILLFTFAKDNALQLHIT